MSTKYHPTNCLIHVVFQFSRAEMNVMSSNYEIKDLCRLTWMTINRLYCRFTTYQDGRRDGLVDDLKSENKYFMSITVKLITQLSRDILTRSPGDPE